MSTGKHHLRDENGNDIDDDWPEVLRLDACDSCDDADRLPANQPPAVRSPSYVDALFVAGIIAFLVLIIGHLIVDWR